MAGLVGYASSDEAEDEEVLDAPNDAQIDAKGAVSEIEVKSALDDQAKPSPPANAGLSIPPDSDSESPTGPAPGPSMPPLEEPQDDHYEDTSAPGSPYSSNRAAVRNLTMPPFPNFDIPPSPPGSPPPASTKKFAHFLELKKKGVHFNERLGKTAALKNPSLFQKLKERAGISEEDQYATSLPEDLAVPTKFPPWAYADELYRSQMKIKARREEEAKKKPRDAIDFVPASASDASSRAITPGGLRFGAKSTAEKKSPQIPGRKR